MSITLILTGKVVPKARPRVTQRGTYFPQAYRDWRSEALLELSRQIPLPWTPIERCEIAITLTGSHRGDLDNLAGAVLDALVSAKIIRDDSCKIVNKLSVEILTTTTKEKMCRIKISFLPGEKKSLKRKRTQRREISAS